MNLSHKNKILLAGVVLFLLIGNYAHAAQVPITNWAWSSNIGWINLNSNNPGSGSGGSYGVTLNDATGALTGYAWSSNIGWIKFGGLSGFPATGNSDGNASVTMATGKVTGWARACAGTLPGDCSNMNSRTDGWDGWIELSGTNHLSPTANGSGGVTYGPTAGVLSGYAWGGDVVGWIDFTPAPPCLASYPNVTVTGSTSGGGVWGSGHWQNPNQYTQDSEVAKAAVHDGLIAVGQTATIAKIFITIRSNYYESSTHSDITTTAYSGSVYGMRLCVVNPAPTNITVVPGSCGADSKPTMVVSWDRVAGATGGYKLYRTPALPATNSSPVNIPQPSSGTRVTFTDTGLAVGSIGYGYHVSAMYGAVEGGRSFPVVPSNTPESCGTLVPAVTISANPNSVNSGSSSNITWTSTNATSCTVSKGTQANWQSRLSGTNIPSGPLTANTIFTINCLGAGGTTASATVTVTATSQTCSIDSTTQDGNDILIRVIVSPRSTTWTKLTRTYSGQTDEVDRERNDTNYTFTDYGAGAQPGLHTYNLNYGTCNATKDITVSPPLTTGFNLSATGPIEIVVIGGLGNRDLTSSAANITITPTPNGGFNSSVTLSLESVTLNDSDKTPVADPTKFIPTFSFTGLTPGTTISVGSPYGVPNDVPKLTITSNKSSPIPIGQYILTIKGDGRGKTATQTIILNVRALSFQYQEF